MITAFDIYVIMILDDIKCVLGALSLAGVMSLAIGGFLCANGACEKVPSLVAAGKKVLKYTLCIMGTTTLLYCVVPSTKTAVMMVSVPAVVNSAMSQKDVPEGIRRLWNKLTEQESSNKEAKDAKAIQESK